MKVKVKLLLKRFPLAFFFERLSWTEEIHSNWNREKKNVLVLRHWPDLYQFSKVSKRTNPLNLVKSGQFFSMQIIEFPSAKQQRNIFYNWLPVHVNISWALGLKWFWMKQFFTKAVLSLFCNNILLQISDMADYNHIPLLNTINVYETSFQD